MTRSVIFEDLAKARADKGVWGGGGTVVGVPVATENSAFSLVRSS